MLPFCLNVAWISVIKVMSLGPLKPRRPFFISFPYKWHESYIVGTQEEGELSMTAPQAEVIVSDKMQLFSIKTKAR